MDALAELLARFEASLGAHEAYFLRAAKTGFAGAAQPEFQAGECAVYEMDAGLTHKRRQAYALAAESFERLEVFGWPQGRREVALGPLIEWAVSEFTLQTLCSFAGFVVLLHELAGAKSLQVAPLLYAAACYHPNHFKPALLGPQASEDMMALREALAAVPIGVAA